MKSVELMRLNLVIEPDLRNFVGFLMESVAYLQGSAFGAALAGLELSQRLPLSGACSGQPFPVSVHLKNNELRVRWGDSEFLVAKFPAVDKSSLDQLCEYLRKSTEAIDPEILNQRNEAMARHLQETLANTERELAELQVKLQSRQAELQASIREAETDPLTMLPNRRAFDEKLKQAFRHTMRQKTSPLSLLMLDLDFFKHINDAHGHLFGDAYLNKMAHILRSVIREDVDYAFRFGGDEFAMMIHADFSTACEKAKQVILSMEGKVSIGIATIDQQTPHDLTLEGFIHQADSALYEAKHRGRGRAVVSLCHRGDTQVCGPDCAVKVSFV